MRMQTDEPCLAVAVLPIAIMTQQIIKLYCNGKTDENRESIYYSHHTFGRLVVLTKYQILSTSRII